MVTSKPVDVLIFTVYCFCLVPTSSPGSSCKSGILKRERPHTFDGARESSPHANQRRVSFASAVEMKLIDGLPLSEIRRPPRTSSPRPRAVRCLLMPRNSPTSPTTSQSQLVHEYCLASHSSTICY